MNTFYKSYIVASGIMGAYGFTRGVRAIHHFDKRENVYIQSTTLIADRIVYGVVNGIMYTLPGWNIIALMRLANRMEIRIRNLNKSSFPFEYQEMFGGYCLSTL